MKQNFKRHFMPIVILCAITSTIYGQTEVNTSFISQMNNVFANLDKSRVPTGLLQDYAYDFTSLDNFNGVLTDTNFVSIGMFRDIYATLATSAVHTNAGSFYHPDYVDSIWWLQRQPGIITLGGIYYNYSRFRDDAVSNNLVTLSNNQFSDRYVNGNWQNPYQTQTVFAMCPPLHSYSGKSFQVVLPTSLWFTNNAAGVANIAVDFGDGNGYNTITPGQPINLAYADTGAKTWQFRLTLTNSATLYSHTYMQVQQEPNSSGGSTQSARTPPRTQGFSPDNHTPILLTADVAYNGEFGQGWITVDFAHNDFTLRNPLIVVEGFDAGYLIAPENKYGLTNYNSFVNSIFSSDLNGLLQGSNQQYDIIYVDWAKGADYLQQNGLLLERVIRWVNERKAADGFGANPNVVLGQSMGGVIGRWALKDMENKNLAHQTRLFINYDGPQQGANVPLAYQYLARHLRNVYPQTNVPNLLNGPNIFNIGLISRLSYVIPNALNLADFPAPQQMLINHLAYNYNLDNSVHDAWQQELRNMGYPAQCRNVAVSNGSECALDQGFQPGATLLSVNGNANTRFFG